jgi:hypothetical protein
MIERYLSFNFNTTKDTTMRQLVGKYIDPTDNEEILVYLEGDKLIDEHGWEFANNIKDIPDIIRAMKKAIGDSSEVIKIENI